MPDGQGIAETLEPVKTAGKDTEFALSYSGYIKVPESGLYTFSVTSDDGSRLTIAEKTITELNILCDLDPWKADGNIALEPGLHPLAIDYFQFKRRHRLKIEYSVNGSEKRDVTPSMLFHGKE